MVKAPERKIFDFSVCLPPALRIDGLAARPEGGACGPRPDDFHRLADGEGAGVGVNGVTVVVSIWSRCAFCQFA